MKFEDNEPIEVCSLPIHPIANEEPLGNAEEQEELKLNIKDRGQQVPISLYRGSIADGRRRAQACEDLGYPPKTENLPNNWTIDELRAWADGQHTRRNLTQTQKGIKAANRYNARKSNKKVKISQKDAAVLFGVKSANFEAALYILNHMPDYADKLFEGHKINIGKDYPSDSLQGISAFVKRFIGNTVSDEPDIGGTLIGKLKTQAAKDHYNKAVTKLGGHQAEAYSGAAVRAYIYNHSDKLVHQKP